MSLSATMDLLQVAADMRACGDAAAAARVVEEVAPDHRYKYRIAWQCLYKGTPRTTPEYRRRLRTIRWLEWQAPLVLPALDFYRSAAPRRSAVVSRRHGATMTVRALAALYKQVYAVPLRRSVGGPK